MTLVCAFVLLSACSGPIMAKSAQGPTAPYQDEREAITAQPSAYPFAVPTPQLPASEIPAPQGAQTHNEEREAQAPVLKDFADAEPEAAGEAQAHIYVEEPEVLEDYEAEVYAFIEDNPREGFSSESYYSDNYYFESYHSESYQPAAIPALFEVNDALIFGMPFDALPESDMAAVMRAIRDQGYEAYVERISVTYKTDTLVSCLVDIGRVTMPVNVDCQTGNIVVLADFFTREDTGWRGLIPDIVVNAANRHGLTLLCDVPPVDGAHPCFVLDGSIVLLYRPYEIATYEAGSPCFTLPMQEIFYYTTGVYGIGG